MGVSGIHVMQRCSDPRELRSRQVTVAQSAHTFAFTMTAPETAGTYTRNTACSGETGGSGDIPEDGAGSGGNANGGSSYHT